jgi:hypothetical protein
MVELGVFYASIYNEIIVLKDAHSVSFENFYLVMFYGNQII